MKIRWEYFGIFGFLDVLKKHSEAIICLYEPCTQKRETISSANVEIGKAFLLSQDGMPRFIAKDLWKAIMKRSRIRNNFHRNRMRKNKTLFTKQRNYPISLLKKSKKKYFANLNEKDLLDKKLLWKKIKPSLHHCLIRQTLRAILKLKNYPSIIAIQNKFKGEKDVGKKKSIS